MRKPFTIGHVAKLAGVSVSTLRAWEAQGLIVPHKSEGGHRTFSQEDIVRAKRIEKYRTISGMSIASIKRQLAQDHDQIRSKEGLKPSVEGRATPAVNIGARVRNLRKQMGWTIRELSERSGIAQSQLSVFERGHGFLGSARLNALASLFGQGLTEVLGGTSAGDSVVTRQGSGRFIEGMGEGVRIEQVTVAERLMDAEFWTIAPGGESDGFYSHEGEELIYLVSGELELTLADANTEVLSQGDCAYFNSRVEHRWRNAGSEPVVVLWVNTDSARLAPMSFAKADRKLGLGALAGGNLGEGSLTIDLPEGVQTYRAVETHTAGHVARILIEPLPGLDQPSLAGKLAYFKNHYDHIRPLLLGEPRGHAAGFGLVPVRSEIADFGALFLTTEGYPLMGNHAVVGYARVLASLGRLAARKTFTIEVPSAVLNVELGRLGDPDNVTISMPDIRLRQDTLTVTVFDRTLAVELGQGTAPAALVNIASLGMELVADNIQRLTDIATHIRSNLATAEGVEALDSVVFYEELEDTVSRQFVVINNRKFDRSPGILGAATRAAQLVRDKRVKAGAILSFESIFGDSIKAEVASIADLSGDPKVDVRVTAKSHLNAVTTFIYEPTDHLYQRDQ